MRSLFALLHAYLCLVNYFEYLGGVPGHRLHAPPHDGAPLQLRQPQGAGGVQVLPVADDVGALPGQCGFLEQIMSGKYHLFLAASSA